MAALDNPWSVTLKFKQLQGYVGSASLSLVLKISLQGPQACYVDALMPLLQNLLQKTERLFREQVSCAVKGSHCYPTSSLHAHMLGPASAELIFRASYAGGEVASPLPCVPRSGSQDTTQQVL